MKLYQSLEGLKGVFKIADDILITGQGETEREADVDHDRNLKSLPSPLLPSWIDAGSGTSNLSRRLHSNAMMCNSLAIA